MLKVLLADDDYQVIKRLENLIDWNTCGFELAGSAYDGNMALRMIIDLNPDIVVTDIVMPGRSGIELIRCAKETGLGLKFIVLSFYTEHTYVREAMKLGALEYLIKDEASPDVLKNALNYAKTILEKERDDEANRKREKENTAKSNELLRQEAIRSLLRGKYKSKIEILQEFERINLDYPKTPFVVACIEVDKIPGANPGESGNILDSAMREYVHKVLNTEAVSLICKTEENSFACIMNFSNISSEMYRKGRVFSDFSNIIRYIGKECGVSVSVGVSSLCGDLSDITEYYRQSMQSVKLKRFFKPGQILFYDGFKTSNDRKYEDEIMGVIAQILKEINTQMSIENVSKSLKEIYEYFKPEYISVEMGSRIVLELNLAFSFLVRRVEEQFGRKLAEMQLTTDSIQYGDFFEDFFHITEKKLKEYETKIRDFSLFSKEMRLEIKEVVDYVKKNYDKKISLEEVAEKVFISKTYLSKLFKKEMGVNFEDFLLDFRMKIASDLLATSNLKIYEIAINLGFCSTQHFSATYRKSRGVSPEAFRMNTAKERLNY